MLKRSYVGIVYNARWKTRKTWRMHCGIIINSIWTTITLAILWTFIYLFIYSLKNVLKRTGWCELKSFSVSTAAVASWWHHVNLLGISDSKSAVINHFLHISLFSFHYLEKKSMIIALLLQLRCNSTKSKELTAQITSSPCYWRLVSRTRTWVLGESRACTVQAVRQVTLAQFFFAHFDKRRRIKNHVT